MNLPNKMLKDKNSMTKTITFVLLAAFIIFIIISSTVLIAQNNESNQTQSNESNGTVSLLNETNQTYGCLTNEDCNDNNSSTIDLCINGTCSYELNETNKSNQTEPPIVEPKCLTDEECDDSNKSTADLCIEGICIYKEIESQNQTNETNETNVTVFFNLVIEDYDGDKVYSQVSIFNKSEEKWEAIDEKVELEHGKYDIHIKLTQDSIKEITINSLEVSEDIKEYKLKIDNNVPLEKGPEDSVQTYAIDPSALNFEEAVVTVAAKGSELWKCKDWNFDLRECKGEWLKIMDITPGQDYNFTLTPEDPAFAETKGLEDGAVFYGVGSTIQARTFNATALNWSSNITVHTAANTIQWVMVKTNPIRYEYAVLLIDASGNFVLGFINGTCVTTLCGTTTLTTWAAGTPFQFADMDYEKNTGNLIIVYSDGTATPKYRIRYENNKSLSSQLSISVTRTTGAVEWVRTSSHPLTNEIAMAYSDVNEDLNALKWNGTAWTAEPTTTLETTMPTTEYQGFGIAHEQLSGDVFLIWGRAGIADLYYATSSNGSTTWSTVTAWTAWAEIGDFVNVNPDLSSDRICIVEKDIAAADTHVGIWLGTAAGAVGNNDATSSTDTVPRGSLDCAFLGSSARAVEVYGDAANIVIDWATWVSDAWTIQTDWTPSPTIGTEANVRVYSFPNLTTNRTLSIIGDVNADLWAKVLTWNGATFSWSNTEGGTALELNLADTNRRAWEFVFLKVKNTAPRWFDVSVNNSNPAPNEVVRHDVRWTDDYGLSYFRFEWNATGANCDSGFSNVTEGSISGTDSWINISQTIPPQCEGKVIGWRQYVNDSQNLWNVTSILLYTVQSFPPTITFVSPTPANNTIQSQNWVYVNVSVTDNVAVDSCLLEWQGVNETMTKVGTGNVSCFVNKTGLASGTYTYKVYANDTSNNWNVSETRIVTVDIIPPTITFVSPTPANNTIISQNWVYVNVSVTDNVAVDSCRLEWQGVNESMTRVGTGANVSCWANKTGLAGNTNYTYKVYANDTSNNWNVSETREVFIGTPPSVVILHPSPGKMFDENDVVVLVANITDPDGLNLTIAEVTLPNSSKQNVTLYIPPNADNFNINTVGIAWTVENESVGANQTCVADIDTTVPDMAYTAISGNGSPRTDTYCGLASMYPVCGDFDMNVTFNITHEEGVDYAMLFALTENPSVIGSSKIVFMSIGNWTGYGRTYDVFINDGNISDYISERPTNDTYGKFRIKRQGTNFTFYTWNHTANDWHEEAHQENVNMPCALFINLESETAETGWGSINITWDDLIINGSQAYTGVFTGTSVSGIYNVTFIARDSLGAINDTEQTYFNITEINDAPSTPYILQPSPNWVIRNIVEILWSNVYDEENNSLQFNITLLNPDYSENATIVTNYGNASTTSYDWDTTLFADGQYSLKVVVFENETVEMLSSYGIITGTFSIDNTPPAIEFVPPTETSGSTINRDYIQVNVTANDLHLDYLEVFLYNSTTLLNQTMSITSPYFVNFTGLSDGLYYFNATAYDSAGNYNYTETRNVTIDTLSPTITFIPPTPANNTIQSQNWVYVNVSVTDNVAVDSCRLEWQGVNESMTRVGTGANVSCWANKTGLAGNTNYTYKVYANDTSNNWNVSETRVVRINSAPQIILNLPLNNTQFNNTQNINFNFTAIDDFNSTLNCSIYLDGTLNQTNASTQNNTLTNFLINGISYGLHNWSINCSDGLLSNVSETRYFSINDTIEPSIYYNQNTDANGTYSKNWIFINVTCSDLNKQIVILNWNGTNESFDNSVGDIYWENKTGLSDGTYTFYAWCNDSYGNNNQTGLRQITLDTTAPNITLNSPNNGYITGNATVTFNCSADDTTNLSNLTLWHNASGWQSNGTTNISDSSNSSNFTRTFSQGTYKWSCSACDVLGNCNTSFAENRTFIVDLATPSIIYVSPTDANNAYVSRLWTYINVTVTDQQNISTCILEWDGMNESMTMIGSGSNVSCYKNKTGTEANYLYRVYANDSSNNIGSAGQRNVTFDITLPRITSVNTISITNNGATIIWTTNENANSTVNYGTNTSLGILKTSAAFVTSHFIPLSSLTANTLYYYNVTSCDLAGNCNTSGYYNFTTLMGGGGGGGAVGEAGSKGYPPLFPSQSPALDCDMTFNLSNFQTATCTIRKYDTIYFIYKGVRHNIFINNLDFRWANITIQSEPINLSLLVNETKAVDLDKDGIYDINITLEKITRDDEGIRQATITIRLILRCDCPQCTEWSSCEENKQTRNCYKCGKETNYTCQEFQEEKFCVEKSKISFGRLCWLLAIIAIVLLVVTIIIVATRKRDKFHTKKTRTLS